MKSYQIIFKKCASLLFILLITTIVSFTQDVVADGEVYEYADGGEYLADDGVYEYADGEEYLADGEVYDYADGEEYLDDDGVYEYADGGEYLADGEVYEYADGGEYLADGEVYEYADGGEYLADESGDGENIEETPTSEFNIFVPLFANYRLPVTVDPKNPVLPVTHNITKLRGTVWRGDDVVLRDNKGVMSEQRLYLFFDKNRDALSYQYISAYTQNMPNFPSGETFIPLSPLLVTNDYVPILVDQSPSPSIPPVEGDIQYTVNPDLSRNYDYETALEIMRQRALDSLQTPDPFTTINTNTMVTTNISENSIPKIVITTNQILSIMTNITSVSNGILEIKQSEVTNTQTTAIETNNNTETQDDSFNTKELANPSELYDIYRDSTQNTLSYSPQFFVSQNLEIPSVSQYIINMGGNTGGIFIHQTDDSEKPYKVIFLSLDEGMTLYEYNIDNSFDVRDGTLTASQRAVELYQRILNEKINMKKFKRVHYKNYFN